MPKATPPTPRPSNWVLEALPPDQYKAVAARLEPVAVEPNTVLYEAGVPLPHVYFLCRGFVSLMAPLRRDRWVEVAVVGRAGVVGLCVVLGSDSANHRALVQTPGEALRITPAALRSVLARAPALSALLLRYADAFVTQVVQSVVCKGHHSLRQRLSRWLMDARARSDSDHLPFTQSLLAEVLTVRAASVSEAVGSLREDGLVTSNAGHLTILDGAGLEAACCPCYRLVAGRFARLRDEYREVAGATYPPAGRRGGKR